MNARLRRLPVVGLVALVAFAVGCSATAPSVVGQWHCTDPTNAAGDAVEVKADGTVTVTIASGQSASGTWTLNGSTVTVHGLGPGGSEDWTLANDKLTSTATGQVCTRA